MSKRFITAGPARCLGGFVCEFPKELMLASFVMLENDSGRVAK